MIRTHILRLITYFRKWCYLSDNVKKKTLEPDKARITIWCMRLVCWITKATNIHSKCVILIAFPLQQWLHDRASMLRYRYIACIVAFVIVR